MPCLLYRNKNGTARAPTAIIFEEPKTSKSHEKYFKKKRKKYFRIFFKFSRIYQIPYKRKESQKNPNRFTMACLALQSLHAACSDAAENNDEIKEILQAVICSSFVDNVWFGVNTAAPTSPALMPATQTLNELPSFSLKHFVPDIEKLSPFRFTPQPEAIPKLEAIPEHTFNLVSNVTTIMTKFKRKLSVWPEFDQDMYLAAQLASVDRRQKRRRF